MIDRMHAMGAGFPNPMGLVASGCCVPAALRNITATATTVAKPLIWARVLVAVVVVAVVALSSLVCAHTRARVMKRCAQQ
jgi:hypothetical protein